MSKEVFEVGQPANRSRIIALALFLIGIPVIAIVLFLSLAPGNRQTTNTGAAIIEGEPYDGSTAIEPPRALQDFTLTTHTGNPLSLSELRGQLVVMFFGYTHCPDFCPTTLLNYQRIRELLGDKADAVRFLFISVDPERDTPPAIAEYLESRGVADFVIGMAGEETTLQRIAPEYGLYYGVQPGTELEEDYLVDHSVVMYLVNRDGQLVMIYSYGAEPGVIAEDIQEQLATA